MGTGSKRTIALISEVFWEEDGADRLAQRLEEARSMGAQLAVLPELPLNPWSPATRSPRAEDAESIDGPRTRLQQAAAKAAGIGLVGGSILVNAKGVRHNTALLIDANGSITGTWEKAHIPDEPGFWEADHYERGETPLAALDGLGFPLGLQICSDMNRPQGSHLLAALGAEVILAPRATESATWNRWKPVLISTALTGCCWVATVNRPRPEEGVLIGGPSFAVDPDGQVLIESTEPVTVFSYDPSALPAHGRSYPGYLDVRSDLYAPAWQQVRDQHPPH
ncbi:MAG: hypothetical protein CBC35_00110 [Planctomycetes bacterium TMED75]|nr:hypothetical protein [Planctomycetaceae bacterium]OUU96935.1 MAG: hypothetical protein CBC35_00110 [Planctomycetes bacterium TMED75]